MVACGDMSKWWMTSGGMFRHWQHEHSLVRARVVRFYHMAGTEEIGLGVHGSSRIRAHSVWAKSVQARGEGGGHIAGRGTSMLSILTIRYDKS